jgi:pantoate--beta-alanine ligase
MKMIEHIHVLQALEKPWRQKGESIALVPTMGNLHAGHLALVQKAKSLADHVVVSIFVNPTQFGPQEDFQRYPRTREADMEKLQSCGVDVVFVPETEEVYPSLSSTLCTRVVVPGLSYELCGVTRPQLFEGVTIVLTKLFHMVQPDIAVFGEKDFQQCVVIRQMVRDLNFPVKIVTGATVREKDGLACSSRNQYLTEDARKKAPVLYATLSEVAAQIEAGNENYLALSEAATRRLVEAGFDKVDYVSIREAEHLGPPRKEDKNVVVLAAAFLGKTRLIDNVTVSI